jgi:20S proteasome subunit alpha 7
VEYAYKAIEAAGTALGVKCSDGVILGVEKLVLSKMLVEGSGRRVHALEEHIGAATAGLNPDGRMLVERARDEARGFRQNFGEPVPPRVLSDRMGAFMHLFTLYGSYRPVGSSILMAGFDAETQQYELHMAEPTGLALVRGGSAPRAPSCALHTAH